MSFYEIGSRKVCKKNKAWYRELALARFFFDDTMTRHTSAQKIYTASSNRGKIKTKEKKKKLRARLFPCQLYHNHEKKGWAKNKDGQGYLRFPQKNS